MQTTNFWTSDYPRPPDLPVTALPDRADVAIIGAGYTGLHAARALAKQGVSVVVLDAETIGWGASSRNGGMLNPGLKLSAPQLFHRYGPELGQEMWHWSLAAIDHVESVVTEANIDCDFRRVGQVVLAAKPQHYGAMQQEVAWHRQELHDSCPTLVAPDVLAGEIGSSIYHGGLFDPRSAALHPAKYVFGLAKAAAGAGAMLVEHAPVDRIHRKTHSNSTQYVVIVGNDGDRENIGEFELLVDEVLIATNGYTKNAVPALRRGIFSGGSYIITTPPLPPELQAELSPHGRMFYDSKHFLNYFRLTPDGRMLFGGRHNLTPNLDLVQSAAALHARLVQVFPQLADIPVSHSWSGQLGLTFDLMPHAGRLQSGPAQGIWFAYGYAGHGVGVASFLGHQMGEWIGGKRPAVILSRIPHFRTPLALAEPLFLPLVSAWYRWLDYIH